MAEPRSWSCGSTQSEEAAFASGSVFSAFYEIVRRIPSGKAAAYGQIARLAGMPRCAGTIGYAMAACRDPSVPCHRVVDRFGGAKICFDAHGPGAQRSLPEAEGVFFRSDGTVDLERSQWDAAADSGL